MIDCTGDGAEPDQEALAACNFDHQGFSKHLQEYLVADFTDQEKAAKVGSTKEKNHKK